MSMMVAIQQMTEMLSRFENKIDDMPNASDSSLDLISERVREIEYAVARIEFTLEEMQKNFGGVSSVLEQVDEIHEAQKRAELAEMRDSARAAMSHALEAQSVPTEPLPTKGRKSKKAVVKTELVEYPF